MSYSVVLCGGDQCRDVSCGSRPAGSPSVRTDVTPHDYDRLLPEQRARVRIDGMLTAAGWVVQDYKSVNLYAGTGVAVRELVTTRVT